MISLTISMLTTASCMFSFASGDTAAALNGLQSCLASVQAWMSMNKLKVNPDKTEFLLIENKQQRSKYLSMFPIELLGVKINPAKSARKSGVIFDKIFTFCSHISVVCNSCFYHMWDLRRIRCHLDLESAKLLATALVCIRLDYCNSLLYGITDIYLTRLQQRVQNWLAQLVTECPPFTCSVPLLRSLHWLPIRFRMLFKINLLTYKTLREKQPVIFTPCLPHHSHPVHWDQVTIIVCQSLESRLTQVVELFMLVPPFLWNNLPLSVHSATSVTTFKKHLKTSLWLVLFSIDTGMPDDPLMLQNCFSDFAVEHWFGLMRHRVWLTRDIGAIEIYLIDWLIEETSEDTCLWLGLSPIDTGMTDGLLMLQNCFLDFDVEHWFSCHTTEPSFAGDIGAIEVCLIDWLNHSKPPWPLVWYAHLIFCLHLLEWYPSHM